VLTVTLPKATVERWTRPDEVSIRGEQPIGGGETLKILVEKDFECLTPREGEDQPDLFPNPAQGTCSPDFQAGPRPRWYHEPSDRTPTVVTAKEATRAAT